MQPICTNIRTQSAIIHHIKKKTFEAIFMDWACLKKWRAEHLTKSQLTVVTVRFMVRLHLCVVLHHTLKMIEHHS